MKQRLTIFTLLCALALMTTAAWGQQVIGSFPTMDGGFEGQASSGSLTSIAYANGSQSAVWTTSSSSMATFQTSSPRTGGKYITVNYTSTTKRLQSPTADNGAIVGGTSYTVQFYYRTAGTIAPGGGTKQTGASSDGTNPTSTMSYTTLTALAATSGVWTKVTASVTAVNSTPTTKYGYLCAWRTATAMGAAMDIDDVVMYAGTVDNTAPDAPTSAILSPLGTTMGVSWTAPATDVDGGGYMVMRGTSDLTGTEPNVNGIYAVGNSVGSNATVVYLGTNTSFTDAGLTNGTTYYYKIYTVDKAFNYSTALVADPILALPVELTSFTATGTRNGAVLTWKTATEKNNFGFNIERRVVNGQSSIVNSWSNVGFVAGHGTSNSANSYSYTDANVAAGTYAYRVAQVDNDGTMKTYNESQVTVGAAAKALTLGNYPNPFNPTTTFEFSVPNDGLTTVKIYNVLGQEVLTAFSSEVKAGTYQHATFDGSKFSSGVYFYSIENNGQRMVKKMLMMK